MGYDRLCEVSVGHINKKGDWHSASRPLVKCALLRLIIAVPGTNRSFVILRERFSQIAGLARWQIAIANRRNHEACDHGIGINYGLL